MVKLEEVLDESLRAEQLGPRDEEEDWDTDDSESVTSETSNLSTADDETLTDRLLALRDIVPPQTRRALHRSYTTASSYVTSGTSFAGKALWVVTSSVLLVGVPWMLAFAEEQQLDMMESEMKAQERAGEMMTMGAGGEKTGNAL